MPDDPVIGYPCPVFQDVCFRPGREERQRQIELSTSVCSADQAPLQLLLMDRWVAERLQKWLTPVNGYRGVIALEVGSGGQINVVRETRRILATELAETGWQDVSFGSIRMTFQNNKPHVLEEERTTKRPVEG